MHVTRVSARFPLGLAVCIFSLAAPAMAQAPAQDFHEAYYLQHETGDLKGALALYEKVAADRRAPAELRERAAALARDLTEELASTDFARLVPDDTIFYLEFNRPGEQLRNLLDQLGLLGAEDARFGISPLLVEGVLGMRGAAVAITEIDPRRGPSGGVAIVHPGDLAVMRGLLETMLPVGGQSTERIGGHPTYSIEGEAFVTLTSRLLIAGRHREDIAGVLARMQNGGEGSLAQSPRMQGAMALRGSDLLFCCLNLEPVLPMIMDSIAQQTRRNPEAALAVAFLDLPSVRTMAGRAGIDKRGMSFDLIVELDEGHRNLAFNLLRMPNLDEQALALVPAGPAFFCVGALNRHGPIPPGETDAAGRPVATMMDFGRELFANVADVAVFVMPEVQRAPWGAMPDVGLAMRVNDPQRSLALWQLLLGTAQAATGGAQPAAPQRNGDVVVHRFDIEGHPIFLAHAGDHLVLSPSERLIGTAVESARNGKSVLRDPVYADALESVGEGSALVAATNLGRCSELGKHFMSERDRRELEPFVGILQDTTLSFGLLQTANRCGVRGRLVGIPDIGPIVTQQIDRALRRGPRRAAARSATTAPDPAAAEAPSLRDQFQRAHDAGRYDIAHALARAVGEDSAGDPMALNNFAWALLTEQQYGSRYDDVGLQLSRKANEATDWGNWYYLDTHARALFKSGAIEQAIELQRKAIAIGADDARIEEAKQSLQEYIAAAEKRGIK